MNARIISLAAICGTALALAHTHAVASNSGRTADRDDGSAVSTSRAAYQCEFASAKSGKAALATACTTAHIEALNARRYDDALRYAAIGCEKRGVAVSCRQAARVPLYMGNEGLAVPQGFAATIRHLAQHVCRSGASLRHAFSRKVDGRECAALARHFVLAADDEYRYGLTPQARSYFESAYDPYFAVVLYANACRRWRDRDACEQIPVLAGLGYSEQPALAYSARTVVAVQPTEPRGGLYGASTFEQYQSDVCESASAGPEMICTGGRCHAASSEVSACLAWLDQRPSERTASLTEGETLAQTTPAAQSALERR